MLMPEAFAVMMAPVLHVSMTMAAAVDLPSKNVGDKHSPSSSKLVGQPYIESYG